MSEGSGMACERYPRIGDHGVIGDQRTAALVATDGTIDFWCAPEFDSPTVFASLLDASHGGRFVIAPPNGRPTSQRYVRDTNVLVTRFAAGSAEVELVDFMPVERAPCASRIVRLVAARGGSTAVRLCCAPRFDYARDRPSIAVHGTTAELYNDRGHRLRLTASIPLAATADEVVAEVRLEDGEHAAFMLQYAPDDRRQTWSVRHAARLMRRTIVHWRRWIARADYRGPWRAAVRRSALALALLHSRRTGAVIAAPTFGLPEHIGGDRNWDFRFSWIRDASFVSFALTRLGLRLPGTSFAAWVADRCAETEMSGELQSVYAIDGRGTLTEETLDYLAGHCGSRPVRIGNAAYEQCQLDIYGELLDALWVEDARDSRMSRALWNRVVPLVNWISENWQRPDQGIWEVRSGSQEFLYSRVMCWVAMDRALRLARRHRFPAPTSAWRASREAIRRDVDENFWNTELQAFVGSKGSAAIDAASLVMPLVGFIASTDPRWLATLAKIEERLVRDALVRRYDMRGMDTDAGSPSAPAFTICSFWYIECLARAGRDEDARRAMGRLLAHANHLGLYSEDLGPDGELLGNFPQGLPHVALIGAALSL